MVWVAFIWAVDLCARPYLLKTVLDGVAQFPRHELMSQLALPLFYFVLLPFVLSTSYRLYNYFIEIKMIPALRAFVLEDALKRLLCKSHQFYQNQYAGTLSSRVGDLVNGVPELFQIGLDKFLSHFLALLFAVYTLWQVSWIFAMIMLGWVSIFVAGIWFVGSPLSKRAAFFAEKGAVLKGGVVDTFGNILPVKLFARIQEELTFLQGLCRDYVQAEQKLQWLYFFVWFIYGYSFVGMHGVNLYFLIQGVRDGWVSVGNFALVMSINLAISNFLWDLMWDFSQFSKLRGNIQQALTAVFSTQEIQDAPGATPLHISKGEIVFKKVNFHYPNALALFQEKSVRLVSGQKVGLVGYSGGGKTTFVNLILRLYELIEGQIFIDGQDIAQVTQASLHQAIGVIPQDSSLFHRTLLENIRYGKQDATDAEVVMAAKQAYAHDFIVKLPEGYGALVGERGIKLSGGQRQRIAIARAMLKNAPILILDEATSQLDSLTENEIQESLWVLMQGKTTLVIAHRLSTLLRMDRILVFEEGKIVEDGTHAQLLKAKGLYKTLWDAQVGGFLPDGKGP
jgi:ATP-binding cassette, subfamily B, bacterial